jgi:mannose-6-phosphate isomerase-like protein (cupin superfamily)
MLIRDVKECKPFTASDETNLCELLHPLREGLDLSYSIAHAALEPGRASLPHGLRESSEVYYILDGEGEMHIDDEHANVGPGQTIYIPPKSVQYIRNTGKVNLKFLCIVHPMWRAKDEFKPAEEDNFEPGE